MEVTKPLVGVSPMGDGASVQAVTRVIIERASKYFQEPS
jgi:hypothetical protein